jgi:hypothetical protein
MLQCLRCPCYLCLLSLIPCLPRMNFLYLIYSLIYVKCYIRLCFFFWWPHPPDASHGHVRCFPFIPCPTCTLYSVCTPASSFLPSFSHIPADVATVADIKATLAAKHPWAQFSSALMRVFLPSLTGRVFTTLCQTEKALAQGQGTFVTDANWW